MRGLDGRVAVITGGASGIGRAVAERLSEEGSKVVVVDRHGDAAEEVVAGLTGEGLAVEADVSKVGDVDGYMDAAREHFGRVDLHHLNAGISGSFAPMAELTPEEFDEVIAVNLRGIFLGIRAALADFTADPRPGAIVTTASLAGVQGGGVASPYVAAKHGVIGLTKSAAMNGARFGVRVNTIAPGVIATPLMTFLEEGSSGEGPDMRAFLENLVPLGRLGESSEVASLVAFLLSDEASYLTGNTILIDGGINVDNHTLRLEPPA
jgi:NAD(P)-dependent dehydrogenase (short-subunit alcohol dehydrogenase family)